MPFFGEKMPFLMKKYQITGVKVAENKPLMHEMKMR